MASLSIADMLSRTKPMAQAPKKKKNWIKSAIKPSHKGAFRKKAEAAGETTREFASEHASDSGTTGAQARLAETLMGMKKPKKRREVMYERG